MCDGSVDCPGGADEEPAQCVALSTLSTVQQDLLLAPVAANVGYLKVRSPSISSFSLLEMMIHLFRLGENIRCVVHLLCSELV